MFTKWKIDLIALSDYRLDANGNLWRMPYTDSKNKYRDWRMLKLQYPSRWAIDGKWWSKSQLRKHIIIDDNPLLIQKLSNTEMPF